jgi:hypothetical protein
LVSAGAAGVVAGLGRNRGGTKNCYYEDWKAGTHDYNHYNLLDKLLFLIN